MGHMANKLCLAFSSTAILISRRRRSMGESLRSLEKLLLPWKKLSSLIAPLDSTGMNTLLLCSPSTYACSKEFPMWTTDSSNHTWRPSAVSVR